MQLRWRGALSQQKDVGFAKAKSRAVLVIAAHREKLAFPGFRYPDQMIEDVLSHHRTVENLSCVDGPTLPSVVASQQPAQHFCSHSGMKACWRLFTIEPSPQYHILPFILSLSPARPPCLYLLCLFALHC